MQIPGFPCGSYRIVRCYSGLTQSVERHIAITSETVITNVTLASALHKRVEMLASEHRQTPNSLMSEAIEQYVHRQEKREQFLKDGVAAWKDYKETGLHLTGQDINAWLERLDAGEDAELPECHLESGLVRHG